MKHILSSIIMMAVFVSSGCSVNRPYAQNIFNPHSTIAKLQPENIKKTTSGSSAPEAANLALTAARRPIPGTIVPHGAEIGLAAASLLLKSGTPKHLNIPDNSNYLKIGMPATEANDEIDAQIKMGTLVEKAIIDALHPIYETRIEEYEDHHGIGGTLRPRWIRINGPSCEQWSCQIHAPIPTATALQWEGKIQKFTTNNKTFYAYPVLSEETIGFVKITKEYDSNKLLSGPIHFVEGIEIPNLDYEQFYQRVSANLPSWVDLCIAQKDKWPYTLNRGVKTINSHI